MPEAGLYKMINALCQVFRKVLFSSHLADSGILPCPTNIAFYREVCDQSVTHLGSRSQISPEGLTIPSAECSKRPENIQSP